MTASASSHGPASYRIRIAGRLDPHWSPWFDGLRIVPEPAGTTSLSGRVSDQAQLHAYLARIRDLGITLLAVEMLAEGDRTLAVRRSRRRDRSARIRPRRVVASGAARSTVRR